MCHSLTVSAFNSIANSSVLVLDFIVEVGIRGSNILWFHSQPQLNDLVLGIEPGSSMTNTSNFVVDVHELEVEELVHLVWQLGRRRVATPRKFAGKAIGHCSVLG